MRHILDDGSWLLFVDRDDDRREELENFLRDNGIVIHVRYLREFGRPELRFDRTERIEGAFEIMEFLTKKLDEQNKIRQQTRGVR